MARVLEYRRIFQINGVELLNDIYPFNKYHAEEIGTALEEDGISLNVAKALCEKWNKMNSNYHYTIPV